MRNNQAHGPDNRFTAEVAVRRRDKQPDQRFTTNCPNVRKQVAAHYHAAQLDTAKNNSAMKKQEPSTSDSKIIKSAPVTQSSHFTAPVQKVAVPNL